ELFVQGPVGHRGVLLGWASREARLPGAYGAKPVSSSARNRTRRAFGSPSPSRRVPAARSRFAVATTSATNADGVPVGSPRAVRRTLTPSSRPTRWLG